VSKAVCRKQGVEESGDAVQGAPCSGHPETNPFNEHGPIEDTQAAAIQPTGASLPTTEAVESEHKATIANGLGRRKDKPDQAMLAE
jgi:hypothetical protein